jgi:SAM-dependent methyltransferase
LIRESESATHGAARSTQRIASTQPMTEPNFFGEGSPYLFHPLLTPERTAREVDFILSRLMLAPGARILDVGCGPGRHAIELARRGYAVTGIDSSAAMIAAARDRAAAAAVSPEFHQVAGESFQAESAFDAAICLFTTLGQISREGENSALVERVYDALVPGGFFVVETPQRSWVTQHLKKEERFGAGQRYTDVTRSYSEKDQTVTEVFEVVSGDTTKRYLLRYCLYSHTELTAMLENAGFSVLGSFGDYGGNPLGPECPTMVVIVRK